jgi:aldehyde:ferredoxin oxidoreductase
MINTENLYSYAGSILRINLSNGLVSIAPVSKYVKEWMGASGIAIRILYDELKEWVTPYDPANKLIFSSGVLLGTTAPSACKMTVNTLGPMTGGWASSCSDSYVGGEIKRSGYDVVIIEGKSHDPVYIFIQDAEIKICDASRLWGKTTWETLDALREELGDSELHSLSIGPAGENLVRGACIIQDRNRAFGRCGTGAVMGSKNLKAIVAKGTGAVRVSRPREFIDASLRIRSKIEHARNSEKFHKYGTLYVLGRKQEICGLNYKNFQECSIPEDMMESIDPVKTIEKTEIARQSFPGCTLGCGRKMHFKDGPYEGLRTEACQFEALNTLQTRLAVREPAFMFKANTFCNQMGLDVDAAGGAIGWAMECFQRKIITEDDTDGLVLNWGDAQLALDLIKKISYREGFGNILAEGCYRASGIIGRGSGYYAMHIKGQDLYEPCRGSNGWLLGTATSTRGGTHTTGALVIESAPDLDKEKAEKVYGAEGLDRPWEYENKPAMVQYMEVVSRIANSLGICLYSTTCLNVDWTDLSDMAELYSCATGMRVAVEDLKTIAMRQLNLEKAFNLRFTNFDRKDDMPTARDLSEPIPSGNLKGWKLDIDKYNKMLDEYYDLHGWDRTTSYPKRDTLIDLGLQDAAADLEKIGKLG